jgi:hypothetical protein
VRGLRRQPVLHRHHDRADQVADHRGDRVLTVHGAEDHPAAVDEVDARQRAGGVHRPVDPHRDVRRAVRPRNDPVLLDDVRVVRHLDAGQHRRDGGAALHDVRDGVEAARQGFEKTLQRYSHLGVDQMTTGHELS